MVRERVPGTVAASNGFTLAEVIVVLAILGVLAAVGAPSLWTYLRVATLRAGAEEIISLLNAARQLAIRMNTTVCVSHDDGGVQYHVGSCGAAGWAGVGTDSTGNIRLANGLRVSGTNNLCFGPLGAGSLTPAPCAANGTLTLTTAGGDARLNVIMAITGRLRVQ
jgi:prepilin-type N-terminal cleavage/methylation domain-containing protein